MEKKIETFLKRTDTYFITTIDVRGFPHTIAVSPPVIRHSFYDLKFYINGDSKTATAIKENHHGSVFCVDPINHESLLLKGFFYLEEVAEYPGLSDKLNDYQKRLNYTRPKIASFETLTMKHYQNMEEFGMEISAPDPEKLR